MQEENGQCISHKNPSEKPFPVVFVFDARQDGEQNDLGKPEFTALVVGESSHIWWKIDI